MSTSSLFIAVIWLYLSSILDYNLSMRRGIANLPLHGGRAPRWLFQRMIKLSRAIVEAMLCEFPPEEFLRRISDPYWFQALGNVLGFDWHSSGLTTTTTGALKEAILSLNTSELLVAGGKGKAAISTPKQVEDLAERYGFDPIPIIKASKLSAKVDTALLQDGYNLYHHTIFFTRGGKWAVVQQGMKEETSYARRYHWLSDALNDFFEEPHAGISAQRKEELVLDLTSHRSNRNRAVVVELTREKPEVVEQRITSLKTLSLPRRHMLLVSDINPRNLRKAMIATYERSPSSMEEILEIRGVGAKFLRALSLVSDIIFGAPVSFEDPAVYSYAHGGKDGTPYPVDRIVYDATIEVLERAIKKAKIGEREKLNALKKVSEVFK